MKPSTLEALKLSIAKWETNAKAQHWREVDIGANSCQLCRFFNRDGMVYNQCFGCPVLAHTGRPYCGETPYSEVFLTMHKFEEDENCMELDELRKLCQAEVDFLKSLLPTGEK
jgi:hypothetical protein